MAEAWKIKYHRADDPSQRWTCGIVAVTKEDALKHLQNALKFPYQVENCEYLGEIHAFSDNLIMRIVQSKQKAQPQAPKEELAKFKCEFCGRICKDQNGLTIHRNRCLKNPDYGKLERERQKRRKEKIEASKEE